ncbi:hypothetical protein SALB1_1244 [Salinisphaera sp. LB1]|nr:hypothetical protein SALB1_1244 [Salinisphaera sp. LB1]
MSYQRARSDYWRVMVSRAGVFRKRVHPQITQISQIKKLCFPQVDAD